LIRVVNFVTIERVLFTKFHKLFLKGILIKKVIDSNYLQSIELKKYLEASPNNHVVIIDYLAMEAYKSCFINSISKSMKILSNYTNQIHILHNTSKVITFKVSGKGIQKRYINQSLTRDFSKYCKHVNLALAGNQSSANDLMGLCREAKQHIDLMTDSAQNGILGIIETAKTYSKSELAIIRSNKTLSPDIMKKIIGNTMSTTGYLLADDAKERELTNIKEIKYSFIFRYSLSVQLLIIDWIEKGGINNLSNERMRNDLIDMFFVTYGTIFDGFLTNDKKANRIYCNTKHFLNELFKQS
jgi:hypothetical protein